MNIKILYLFLSFVSAKLCETYFRGSPWSFSFSYLRLNGIIFQAHNTTANEMLSSKLKARNIRFIIIIRAKTKWQRQLFHQISCLYLQLLCLIPASTRKKNIEKTYIRINSFIGNAESESNKRQNVWE